MSTTAHLCRPRRLAAADTPRRSRIQALTLGTPHHFVQQIEIGFQLWPEPAGLEGLFGALVHGFHVLLLGDLLKCTISEFTAESGNFHSQVSSHANLYSGL
jgi:hypothetical protein